MSDIWPALVDLALSLTAGGIEKYEFHLTRRHWGLLINEVDKHVTFKPETPPPFTWFDLTTKFGKVRFQWREKEEEKENGESRDVG